MDVELLKKKDIDSYIELIKEIFGYESLKENVEKYLKKNKILIIKKDNIVVASVSIEEQFEYVKNQKFYRINYLAVKKDYRRQKLASKLFEKIEEYVKENNINYLELTSGNQRRNAHYFYKSKDFKIKDTSVFVKMY